MLIRPRLDDPTLKEGNSLGILLLLYKLLVCLSSLFAIRMLSPQTMNLPLTCENCFLSYGEFCLAYSSKFEELIKLCQKHGMMFFFQSK